MRNQSPDRKQLVEQLISAGKYDEAWKIILKFIRKKPKDTYFLNEAARLARYEKKYQESKAYYQKILSLAPNDVVAWNGFGILSYEHGHYDEAEKYYKNAVRLLKNYPACHNNLGILLHKLYRHEEAIHHYQTALEQKPDHYEARYGLSAALAHIGRSEEAIRNLDYLVKHRPDDIRAQTALGMLLIQQGKYREGWPLYRGRYATNNAHAFAVSPRFNRPYWEGGDLTGKTILVFTEQGYGDEIQFSRYISRLKSEKGAAIVYFVSREETSSLFRTLPGVDLIIEKKQDTTYPNFHTWIMLLDLPYHFTDTSDPFAPLPDYLKIPETRKALPVAADLPRIGLVWKGNPQHKNDNYRSLPGLNALAPLWSVPGIAWFSLQKGAGEEEIEAASGQQPLTALGHTFNDYMDTAAAIAEMDLIITVDTSVAHLAGALNKACWVLIPAIGTDWRWSRTSSVTPWYPAMKLYHSRSDGGWHDAISAVRQSLEAWRNAWRPS